MWGPLGVAGVTPERWGEVKAVLRAALETAAPERAVLLDRVCGTNAALRREVDSLLAADRADSFLEVPAAHAVDVAGWNGDANTGSDGRGPADEAELRGRLAAALAGRYEIERELGRGGMATVYLARDLRHGRPFALKVVRPDLAAAVGGERFLREIETTARLAHPHVLPLLDSGEAAGVLYYAMPYVAGESLRARLTRERQLPVDDALRIAREVADALDYAHRQGVVHRDVKPENILLEDGHAVVADFGIARAITTAGGERLAETLTATGAVGTPAYMSPEQSAGAREVDGRSDVYALGCVLYELLAGEPPFTGPTAESVIRQHLTAAAPPLTGLCPTLPPAVAVAVTRALAKGPADRFSTAAQFADALRLPAEGGDVSRATPAAPGVSRAARTRRRRVAISALAMIAVAVPAVGAWTARARLRGTAPTPQASAPPARRAYTVVAGVDGTADAEDRGAARNLLLTALDQSGIVASLPDEQLRLGLASAGKPDSLPVDVGTATELAVRGGLRTVIAPRVDRVGGTYHVSVRVLDPDSGTALVTERAIARGANELIPAIDGVIAAVRRRLGEQPESLAASRPLEWAATPSFAAIRALQRAAKVADRRDAHADVPLIWEALALDPDFAFAWSRLGVALSNAGFPDSAAWAWNEALARPNRLTEAQRLRVIGYLAMHRRDFAGAVEVWARDVRMFGADPNNLSLTLDRLDRTAEGVALMEEWARTTPFGISLGNRANHAVLLARLGRFAETPL